MNALSPTGIPSGVRFALIALTGCYMQPPANDYPRLAAPGDVVVVESVDD